MKVIWLASYPRSGNTWLRFLLYNYVYGEVRESGDINKAIPPIHRFRLNEQYNGTILSKTHFAWSPAHPHCNKTIGFIYILRNPKDVLLSGYNYALLGGSHNLDPGVFARQFIQSCGVVKWREKGFGSWPEHITSWLSNQHLPHIAIRYETLLDNTHECLKHIVRFLNLEIDEQRITRAVELSSFENLKKMEHAEKKSRKTNVLFPGTKNQAASGVSFMHKGRKGQSLAHISPQLDRLFDTRFAPILESIDTLLHDSAGLSKNRVVFSKIVLHDWHEKKIVPPQRTLKIKQAQNISIAAGAADRTRTTQTDRTDFPAASGQGYQNALVALQKGLGGKSTHYTAEAHTTHGTCTPPPFLINSLPKSGTYLLEKAVSMLPGVSPVNKPLVHSTVARISSTDDMENPNIPIGVDWPLLVSPKAIRCYLRNFTSGSYAISHVPFSEEFKSLLAESNMKSLLILRDPRNVVVSHANFVARYQKHFLYELYQKLSEPERIMKSITGVKQSAPETPWLLNIAERYRSVLRWTAQPCNYTTFFEKLIGPQGGGSREIQIEELQRIAQHLEICCTQQDLDQIAANLFGGSRTFNKGAIGSWRHILLPEHKQAFKDVAGQLLIELGYEQGYDW